MEDSDRLHKHACDTWPRIYLDTGELLKVADGEVDGGLLHELLSVMAERRGILVLSIEHIQDAVPRADPSTVSRMADALELFPLRAMVLTGPDQIEPWQNTNVDIEIGIASNTRELLSAPVSAPALRAFADMQDHLEVANVETQEARRALAMPPPVGVIVFKCLLALVRGHNGTTPAEVVAGLELELGTPLAPPLRETVTAHIAPWAVLLQQVDKSVGLSPERRLELLYGIRNTLDPNNRLHSPGMYLAKLVSDCLWANVSRVPRRSDIVDGAHVRYIPYVDVATCDRQVYACLAKHLPVPMGSRVARVFRNGRLREVLAAVADLPIGTLISDNDVPLD